MSKVALTSPGLCAPRRQGLVACRWLLARRAVQLGILGAFLLGPLAGLWLVKGNLSYSLTLDTLPLTDWFVLLQTFAAGQVPGRMALIGGLIVIVFYLLVGGRSYCAWVCPVNIVTDSAAWLRRRLDLRSGRAPAPGLRHALLGVILGLNALLGALVWEWVNPVSLLHRGLLFGFGLGWTVVAGIFLYDLFLAPRGWCGHLCPMGAAYGLLGRFALLRVSAQGRTRCDDCMDCYSVCPEPQVIRPALKALGNAGPVILASACSNCGRCADVCHQNVFRFTTRFDTRSEP